MKNRLAFLFAGLFMTFSVAAGECYAYRFMNPDSSDFYTGKMIRFVNAPEDLENAEKIIRAEITIGNENGYNKIGLYFENGFLKKRTVSYPENDELVYEYDGNGNLVKANPDFSFKYVDNCGRELYSISGLQSKIFFIDDGNIKKFEVHNKFRFTSEVEYEYDENFNLMQFRNTSFRYDGKISCINTFSYEYDENMRLIKITEKYDFPDRVETRRIINIEYDKNGNVSMVRENQLTRPEESSVTYFSDYDSFGNWRTSKKYQGKVLIETVSRTILYK